MVTLVELLRLAALFSFAAFMLSHPARRRKENRAGSPERTSGRTPVAANLAAFALFLVTTVWLSSAPEKPFALPLALLGASISIAGAAFVYRARIALGAAWSLAAQADQTTGLIKNGPYRVVRHPIYLGLAVLGLGQALAFGSGPALLVLLAAVVPTLAWRARTEEALLARMFGKDYTEYRTRTWMLFPGLL